MKVILKKIFDPYFISAFLLIILIFLLLIRFDVLSVKITSKKNSANNAIPQKTEKKVSTSSAWYADPIQPTVSEKSKSKLNSTDSQDTPSNSAITPSPVNGNDNSTSENYVYPIYIQETNSQPVRNYDSLYIKSIGMTYSCLDTRHAEILLAQEDYLKTVDEITKICLNNDLTSYEVCADSCSPDNYKICEQNCYNKIDWKCSVNPTDSPQYRTLEHLLGMYCK